MKRTGGAVAWGLVPEQGTWVAGSNEMISSSPWPTRNAASDSGFFQASTVIEPAPVRGAWVVGLFFSAGVSRVTGAILLKTC